MNVNNMLLMISKGEVLFIINGHIDIEHYTWLFLVEISELLFAFFSLNVRVCFKFPSGT